MWTRVSRSTVRQPIEQSPFRLLWVGWDMSSSSTTLQARLILVQLMELEPRRLTDLLQRRLLLAALFVSCPVELTGLVSRNMKWQYMTLVNMELEITVSE